MIWVGLGLMMCIRTIRFYPLPRASTAILTLSLIEGTGGAGYFLRLATTASSLGIHTTTVSRTMVYKSMISANGGNYAGQYPCDGWVDTYNLETTPSIGRIPTLAPSFIDNRWRVQTPSNMPIGRSRRDLLTPPLSLRVPPPSLCFGRKRPLSKIPFQRPGSK